MFNRRKRLERQFESEVEYHLDRTVQSYIAQGMDAHEARRRARLEFGGAVQIQEDLRDVHHARWLADLRQDLVYAARTLRRSPGFLVCAVATLALGIGANTAIFSLIDAVMLQPLPVRDPSGLVQIARLSDTGGDRAVSYPLFEYFRARLSSISGAFVEMPLVNTITLGGVDEQIYGDAVTGEYYSVLGLAPAAGRLLGPEDNVAPSPVAVISYAYWRRRFALDPGAVGKTFIAGRTALTIVGVEPLGFSSIAHGRTSDFTVPLFMTEQINGGSAAWRQRWDFNLLAMMARLKPGVTVTRANAEVEALSDEWRRDKAASLRGDFQRDRFLKERAAALPAAAGLNGLRYEFFEPLAVLMCIVALVLLLACANLSGLLLARASSRQREVSIRRALGAGNGRLARQFLAESMLLAALGAMVGFALAQWFSRALIAMMANGDQLDLSVSPDWRILAFTGAISLMACVAAGLAPGLNAGRSNVNPALKQVRSGGHRRLGRSLVVAQLCVSMTLLIGASLFIRTVVKLYSVDTGIRTDSVFLFNINTKGPFPRARALAIQSAIVDRLRSMPGVLYASAAANLPISGSPWTQSVQVEGYVFRPGEDDTVAFNAIAPKFFAVTAMPLLLGRDFNERDGDGSKPVAIVSQSFVRSYFGGQPPLGRHVTSANVAYEIVGVVGDAKYGSLRAAMQKTVYISWMQREGGRPTGYQYFARIAGVDPMRVAPAMERAIPEIDSALRLRLPRSYADAIDQSTLNERMMATLGGFFGLLALIMACLGIFGIMAFQVSRRINELGVRMALGATRANIVMLVLREVVMLLIPGCAAGCIVAACLTRFAGSMLFEVTPTDPVAFALAACALATATLAAGFLPALRASRIHPMAALRHE
jgi:predicted permease